MAPIGFCFTNDSIYELAGFDSSGRETLIYGKYGRGTELRTTGRDGAETAAEAREVETGLENIGAEAAAEARGAEATFFKSTAL